MASILAFRRGTPRLAPLLSAWSTAVPTFTAPPHSTTEPLLPSFYRSSAYQPLAGVPKTLAFSTVAGDYKEETLNKDKGTFETADKLTKDDGSTPAPHPSKLSAEKGTSYMLMHPVYTQEYVRSIQPKHRPPQGVLDNLAFYTIQLVRGTFDRITGYGPDMTTSKWLTRVVFLETVAGVPGMVGAMIRHLHSLRLMRRDNGWIHTLLEEAENERIHLLTFLQLKQPGIFMRSMVLLTQGIFCNVFFLAYLVSPKYCHRMVGYLEEEAVRTYTHMISDIEAGKLPEWADADVPEIAMTYWRLPKDAKMVDLIYAVRADEACHSHVNHTFAALKASDANPFGTGANHVP